MNLDPVVNTLGAGDPDLHHFEVFVFHEVDQGWSGRIKSVFRAVGASTDHEPVKAAT